ncbi:Axin-1 [Manis pentadactyla]|nr:Axin-1 [Manis pentadactyla]
MERPRLAAAAAAEASAREGRRVGGGSSALSLSAVSRYWLVGEERGVIRFCGSESVTPATPEGGGEGGWSAVVIFRGALKRLAGRKKLRG